jgi:translation initiation factor 4E
MSSTEDAQQAVVLAPQKSRRTRSAAPNTTDAGDAAVEEVEVTKHALMHDWSLFGLCTIPSKGKGKAQTQNVNVYEFNTVEDFWSIYNSLLTPSQILSKTNVIFLRKGAKPEWEDEFNKGGGEWITEIDPASPNRKKLDAMWEQTVLSAMGGTLADPDDIAGIWLQVRVNKTDSKNPIYKILIWNRNSSAEKAGKLGEAWVELLCDKAGAEAPPCTYVSHADAVRNHEEATKAKDYSREPPVSFSHNVTKGRK